MKRVIITLLCLLIIWPMPIAHAQEDTTPSAEIRRMIRERIEQTLQERSSTGQEYIGVIGSVVKVGTSTFTIMDSWGRERTVEIDDNTAYFSGQREVTLQDLSIGSGVAAIGRTVDELVVDGLRILISANEYTEDRQVYVGTITQWNQRNLTIEARGSANVESFNVNNRTIYEDNTGAKILARDIEEDQAVLLIARDDGTNRTITTLRLLAPLDR